MHLCTFKKEVFEISIPSLVKLDQITDPFQVSYMENNEKTMLDLLVQQHINDNRNDDVAMRFKQMMPNITSNQYCLRYFINSASVIHMLLHKKTGQPTVNCLY